VKILLGMAALLAVGAACTGCDVSPPAATVDGITITQSQLESQLSEIAQNQYALCAVELQGANLTSVTGAGDSTVSSGFAAYELSTMVLNALIGKDLDQLHHPVTQSEVDSATTDLEVQFDSASSSGASQCAQQLTGAQLLQHLPASFSAQQVRYLADEEQLAVAVAHVDLSNAALERYYSAHLSDFSQTCISDIEVTSQEQAQLILAAISAGTSTFGDEAKQSSIDTQTAPGGGAVTPCFTSAQIQGSSILSQISSLNTGQVSQPIQTTTSSGSTVWLLLQVTSNPETPFSQVVPQIRLALLSAQDTKLSSEFNRIVSRARVTVDPRYGTWGHLQGVRPPVPPPAKFVLSPSADQAAGSSSALGG
jgi:parvulin-like peptidyl-prolyl isomerase